jgi:hypothetical protein
MSERLVGASADFASLFGTFQDAIGRARKLVSLGETGAQLQELLLESRQLLATMEHYARLAPEDTRDSLMELCDGADRSLGKLYQAVPQDSGLRLTAQESPRRGV